MKGNNSQFFDEITIKASPPIYILFVRGFWAGQGGGVLVSHRHSDIGHTSLKILCLSVSLQQTNISFVDVTMKLEKGQTKELCQI